MSDTSVAVKVDIQHLSGGVLVRTWVEGECEPDAPLVDLIEYLDLEGAGITDADFRIKAIAFL